MVTLCRSDDLAAPLAAWTPVYTAPAAAAASGLVRQTVPADQPRWFFRLVANDYRTPDRMVWVRPGKFVMGSPPYEIGRAANESPEHEVTIAQGFWLGKYEVTQGEYTELAPYNPSVHRGDPALPVEGLTWESATNYLARLTAREKAAGRLPPGYVYRLPTEAEWEYACRAGTQTAYSFGDRPESLGSYGWFGGGGADGQTHPVGLLAPNGWGLYDMHGNVFEFVLDWYQAYPGGVIDSRISKHVIRGGSFYCPDWVLRSACRNHQLLPNERSALAGFRVALGPRQPLDDLRQPAREP